MNNRRDGRRDEAKDKRMAERRSEGRGERRPVREKEKRPESAQQERPNEMIKHKNEFFASCPIGLEELLITELKEIGIKEISIARGGANFSCFTQIQILLTMFSYA